MKRTCTRNIVSVAATGALLAVLLNVLQAAKADAGSMVVAALGDGPPGNPIGGDQNAITPRQPASSAGPATEGSSQPPAPTTGNPLWAIPLRALSATRERPLFSPSRRPPTPPVATPPAPPPRTAAAPPPPPPEPPTLILIGTVVGGGESIAIFFEPQQKKTVRLRLGEADPKGWKLSAVDARSALVERGRQSVTLALPAFSDRTGPPNVPFGFPGAGAAASDL